MNIALFKKIRNRIKNTPESYDQSTYYAPNKKSPCGTAECLAGDAIICDAPDVATGIRRLRYHERKDNVAERAAKLLGITKPEWGGENESARLFAYSSGHMTDEERPAVRWPEPFASQFSKAKTNRGRAAAAVRYLDWIIANKRLRP